ncbi:hypothetical protein O6H91_05G123300 [Diphasiastrum complanatum]|uniref:Uncharacterized protein n=1 Tax=Diphasiastrum complanatum TaxID=34168 RepID=A0ACC2DSW7_DIPCM|nr:hypothetical protein O6H91_05G123300 [Diphasiastrum complanatum]
MASVEAAASAVRSKADNLFSLEEGFFASAVVYWEGFSTDAVGSEAAGSTTEHKRELGAVLNRDGDTDHETREEIGHEEALAKEGATSLRRWVCNSCGFKFQTGDEQRSHFKSDYHRLNIKRKMVGKKPFSEEQFEAFAEGRGDEDSSLSSISGSDTASDDSDVEDLGYNKDNFQERFKYPLEKNASKYVSFVLQSGEIVSFWRCVLAHNKELLQRENGSICLDSNMEKPFVTERELLRRLNLLSGSSTRFKCLWVVLLNAGGHFAGVVKDMRDGSVLAHQTFHRYVVRAKAGGRQSSKDATGRAPKSAGASLRRYNELALEKDIKELLKSWQQYIELADCIFVHAPSRNRQALFGGRIPLLTHSDNRFRQVPFTTRRPTFKEAKRVLHNLTTLIYRVDDRNSSSASLRLNESSRGQANESKDQSTLAVLEHSKGLKNKQTPVYQETNNESSKLHDARSNPSGVESQEIMENMMSTEDALHMSTALHEAAKFGNADLVSELLDNGADPCVRDSRGRTPYALASTKESRNAFRKFMAHHPEKWDWHAANVPSPLTEELEAAQAIKQVLCRLTYSSCKSLFLACDGIRICDSFCTKEF